MGEVLAEVIVAILELSAEILVGFLERWRDGGGGALNLGAMESRDER